MDVARGQVLRRLIGERGFGDVVSGQEIDKFAKPKIGLIPREAEALLSATELLERVSQDTIIDAKRRIILYSEQFR